MSYRIGIIGGGVSGLSVAYFLEQASPELELTIFETEDRIGGKVQTFRGPRGEVIEWGADSVLLRKDSPLETLLMELGLASEIITPLKRTFSVQREGTLHEVPLGMLQGMPKNLLALWQCSLFSLYGKIVATMRGAYDLLFSPSLKGDPSIAATLRSRYGEEVSKYFFETVFGGIHSGNADTLSFRSLYPDMANRKRAKGGKYHQARFISLRGGMGMLPERIQGALTRTTIELSAGIKRVILTESGAYQVVTGSGAAAEFDEVIIATPAWAAANIVQELSPLLAEGLSAIEHSSSAVVSMVLEGKHLAVSPKGSGYLLAPEEGGYVTGCTYSSEKWDFRRGSDPDTVLVRVFFGRNGGVASVSDEELLSAARKEIEKKLGYKNIPRYESLARWDRGLPQYACGHAERLLQITNEASTYKGLHFIGTSYRGVGIPDCVKESHVTAQKIVHEVRERTIQQGGSNGVSSSSSLKETFENQHTTGEGQEERYGTTICA